MIGWTLCSGIGAPEVAAPWADWWLASEIEPFPRAVLAERFGYRLPGDHNQGEPLLWCDMTEVTPELARVRGVPLPDLLVAGTPCQAFSVAGLRQGTADPRGNLTLSFVETCHAIADARPDGKLAVLWENVPGVLSDKGNAFGAFLGGLVGAMDALQPPADGSWPGEGMVQGPRARAAWCVLDAQHFGVAQRRRRVFVVVDFGNCVDPAAILLEPDRLRGDSAPRREAEQGVAGDVGKSTSHWSGGAHAALSQSHNTGGIGASNQELFSQGGAGLGPDRAAVAAARMVAFGEYSEDGSASALKARDYKDATDLVYPIAFDCKGTEVQHDASGVSPPLRSMGHNNSHQNAGGHAAVAFDLRGRDGGAMVESVGQAVSLRAADGGSSRSYVAVGGDTAHSLTGEGHDASEDGTGRGTPVVAFAENQQGADRTAEVVPALSKGGGKPGQGYPAIQSGPVVRRLMPVECARLQGFPDDHTAITYRNKPAADGPQYKAYGNSMAVPCIAYILDRLRLSWEASK